jgi:uncharacterized membrane protein
VWPTAAVALVREAPDASNWQRIHTRQALAFGVASSLGFFLLLAIPLLVVIVDSAITTGTTVAVYAAGGLADVMVAAALFGLSLWYSARAGRGELFSIPLVSPFADAVFRTRR